VGGSGGVKGGVGGGRKEKGGWSGGSGISGGGAGKVEELRREKEVGGGVKGW